MKEPLLSDRSLLEDLRQTRDSADVFHVWWLGQSGFLIQWNGERLIFDPYLSESLTKKYLSTDKPHTRMTRRVIAPERLENIRVVTSTHNHTDHLDAETLLPLIDTNPELTLVIPEANRAFVSERLKCDPGWPLGLNDGESTIVGPFTIHAVPAAHETIERDERGRCKFLGYVVRFGSFAVYHSGDTVPYDGMAERLRPFQVDLALLPINGAKPERRVSGNLDGPQAAQLACAMGARIAVPCHFDLFEFNTASPGAFVTECQRLGQPYAVLENGEKLRMEKR